MNCNVKEIPDLEDYNQDLKFAKDMFDVTIKELENQKLSVKMQLMGLQTSLNAIKYGTKRDKDGNIVEESDDILETRTPAEIEYEKRKELEEKERKAKLCKETVANSVTSIARLCFQLKEKPTVDQHNVLQKLSVIGLRLEHMMSILMQKYNSIGITPLEYVSTHFLF